MRDRTKFIGFMVLGFLALSGVSQADADTDRRQEAAIKDSQDWAVGIIQGLGTLAPPPQVASQPREAASSRQPGTRHSKPSPKAAPHEAAQVVVPASETKAYDYQQKGRYTEVIIKIKDKIENGVSKNFRITVTSTQPLTGWTVRVRGSDTVLAQGGLFGESSFSKLIAQPFRPDYVMNLSVKRDGSDWVDFFKLYNEGTVQSR